MTKIPKVIYIYKQLKIRKNIEKFFYIDFYFLFFFGEISRIIDTFFPDIRTHFYTKIIHIEKLKWELQKLKWLLEIAQNLIL